MYGLDIFANTNSIATAGAGKGYAYGNRWQYNSQSNRHSDTAVWAAFFDLLAHCELLQSHVVAGKVGLGINYELVSPLTGLKKNLDLVLGRRLSTAIAPPAGQPQTFKQLGKVYGMALSSAQQTVLNALPDVPLLSATSLPICISIEAKACMTSHGKVHKSRLASELNDIHQVIHTATSGAIAAALVMVNAAARFVSPNLNKHPLPPLAGCKPIVWSRHTQPSDAQKVVQSMQALPRATHMTPFGFDTLGIGVISLENDGVTPMTVVATTPPAPGPSDRGYYESFIVELCQLYSTRFSSL